MLTISTRKMIYSSLVMMGLLTLAFGGLGLAKAANNSQSAQDVAVCQGLQDAFALVELAADLDIDDATRDELEETLDEIEDAIEAEEEGKFDRALELKEEIVERLDRLSATDNADLASLLLDAIIVLEPCIVPLPDPVPVPQPASHIVYSAKFVCGRNVDREAMVTPNFGRQPFLFNEEIYQTEINVHNYHLNRVAVWGQVMVANSHDDPRGPVSPLARRVIRPNEAFKVNCKDIREALGPDDPKVCPGKRVALNILTNILEHPATDVVSADLLGEVKEVAVMIEKAIVLEEEGAFKEALELEREIVENLTELAEKAEANRNPRLARALTEARNIVRRCILSAAGEVDTLNETDALTIRPVKLPRLVEGFVVIRTLAQLEVTGVYRAKSHNKTVSGGIGSGTSIDVEQISPHRVRGPIPLPADTAQ